jgi:glycerol-3-phosphate acyltransferase PlsY
MNFLSEINNYFLLLGVMACSYLVGSISFGIIVTKLIGIDNLRSTGSGNIGATNVLRTGNKLAAALTLILDSGKGYVVIVLVTSFLGNAYLVCAGLAVFLGHIFPIYHRFKGGKGVATFLGIILATNFIVGALVCFFWIFIALISKKSSLAALGSSLICPFFLFVVEADEKVLFSGFLVLMIWLLHKENIKRILSGTEPSINLQK